MVAWRLRFSPRTRTIPLIAIAVAAVIFLIISYQYSSYTLSQINTAAVEGIHSNALIQVTDSAGVLISKLEGTASSVRVLAASLAQNSSVSGPLLAAGQASEGGFTSDYFWIGANGTLLGLDNGTTVSVAQYAGANYSQRPYFAGAEKAAGVYFTGAVPSLSNASASHVFISAAVYKGNSTAGGSFAGVVGAAIDLVSLGSYLKSEVSQALNAQLGMLDSNGTILYSATTALIGKSFFDSEIQGQIPVGLRGSLNDTISRSLQGETGFSDIRANGANFTIAYSPIELQGLYSVAGSHQFGVLYLVLADTLTGNNAVLISQLSVLSSFIIIGIAGISVGAAVIFLGWHRRLDDVVAKRTADLVVANEQLKAYAQSQTDFVNIAAHELRTPTQSILGFTEILQDALNERASGTVGATPTLEEEDVKQAISSIGNNARRLKKLTDDILTVSRIDDNRVSLSRDSFDLNDSIRDVISEVEKANSVDGKREAPLVVTFEQAEKSLPVVADNTKVHEVLTNLLTNAVRFSEGKGEIVVRAGKTEKDEAIVSVKDQGRGIDPAILPRLFNKFVTTSPSGTGLGLFIASKLVSAHGGRMWAENNNPPERGSTFTFTLPRGNPERRIPS